MVYDEIKRLIGFSVDLPGFSEWKTAVNSVSAFEKTVRELSETAVSETMTEIELSKLEGTAARAKQSYDRVSADALARAELRKADVIRYEEWMSVYNACLNRYADMNKRLDGLALKVEAEPLLIETGEEIPTREALRARREKLVSYQTTLAAYSSMSASAQYAAITARLNVLKENLERCERPYSPTFTGTGEIRLSYKNAYYKGEIVSGQAHGKGVAIADGEKYVGEFQNGVLGGIAEKTAKDGLIYRGLFTDFKLVKGSVRYDSKTLYEGDFSGDRPHGNGKLTIKSKVFTGTFKNGSATSGTFTDNVGEYTGAVKGSCAKRFSDFMRSGHGTLVYTDGKKYVGNFVEGLRQGEGTLFDAYGSVDYKGNWNEDEKAPVGAQKYYLDGLDAYEEEDWQYAQSCFAKCRNYEDGEKYYQLASKKYNEQCALKAAKERREKAKERIGFSVWIVFSVIVGCGLIVGSTFLLKHFHSLEYLPFFVAGCCYAYVSLIKQMQYEDDAKKVVYIGQGFLYAWLIAGKFILGYGWFNMICCVVVAPIVINLQNNYVSEICGREKLNKYVVLLGMFVFYALMELALPKLAEKSFWNSLWLVPVASSLGSGMVMQIKNMELEDSDVIGYMYGFALCIMGYVRAIIIVIAAIGWVWWLVFYFILLAGAAFMGIGGAMGVSTGVQKLLEDR